MGRECYEQRLKAGGSRVLWKIRKSVPVLGVSPAVRGIARGESPVGSVRDFMFIEFYAEKCYFPVYLFFKSFQLVSKTKLDYHYFAARNKLMALRCRP